MDLSKGAMDFSGAKSYMLDGSQPIILSIDEARALLPEYAQSGIDSTMRKAVLTAVMAVFNFLWVRIGVQYAALKSPRFASGAMLDLWGVRLQTPRVNGEDDGPYRVRLLNPPASRTPNAIRAAVTALFAATTGTSPAFQEPAADGFFLGSETQTPWGAWLQPDGGFYWGYDPLNVNQTWGTYLVADAASGQNGAQFWIIMQLGAGDNGASGYQPDDVGVYTDPNDFLGDDATPSAAFMFLANDTDSLDVKTIALTEARRAFGVSWMLLEESNLLGAI